jgi:hypothetical protein
MRKLITTLTATILMAGSVGLKAEAAAVTGVGSLPPPIKSYSPLQRVDCFLSPCSHPYNDPYYRPYRYGYNGYGYNGYGYRPYAITVMVIGLMVMGMVGATRTAQAGRRPKPTPPLLILLS